MLWSLMAFPQPETLWISDQFNVRVPKRLCVEISLSEIVVFAVNEYREKRNTSAKKAEIGRMEIKSVLFHEENSAIARTPKTTNKNTS